MPTPADSHDPHASLPQVSSDLSKRLRQQLGDQVDPHLTLTCATGESDGAEVTAPAPPSTTGERYTFESEIARGGMGAVLGVYDQDLRRRLAMKVILTGEDGGIRPNTMGRFLEEAQVTAQLDHPGVVPVHELGLDGSGQVYFTMKLVKGEDLKAVFEKVRTGEEHWSTTRALNVLLRACEAMAFAHSKGVIHRDLKPANIMVGRFGEVYVMDWGVARVLGQPDHKDLRLRPDVPQTSVVHSPRKDAAASDDSPDSPLLTMDGDVVGTPAYMPPEQARGRLDDIGPQSDVYSMGTILYELLARQMPYVTAGDRISARTLLGMVIQGPPTPVEELAPTSPPELLAICSKAMAREKEDRYSSIDELAEDLRAFLEQRVVRAYRTGPVVELRKWVQRNRGLAASLLAWLVLLPVGLGGAAAVVAAMTKEKNKQLNVANAQLAATVDERDKANASLETKNQELDGLNQALNTANVDLETSYEKLAAANSELIEAVEERDQANTALNESNEALGEVNANLITANSKLDERNHLLADLMVLEALKFEEQRLWPAHPRLLGAMDDWIATGRDLLIRLPDHEQDLEVLRQSAAPVTDEVLGEALARSPRRRAFEDAAMSLAEAEAALAALPEDEGKSVQGSAMEADEPADDPTAQRRAALISQRDTALALRTEVEDAARAAVQWRFPDDPELQWLHDNLAALVEGARALAAPDTGLLASMETRRDRAATIAETTVGEHFDAWLEAIEGVASSEHYEGLALNEQVGLVPIGADPDSGLWEFWHTESGTRPERDPHTGRIVVTEEMGIVLVLIPASTFWMGAEDDPDDPDPDFTPYKREGPAHEVTLAPFLLSKYELTQGQWFRMTGERPSQYAADGTWGGNTILEGNPVTNVSWEDGHRVLPRFDLRLPTEAQWECACRAGSQSPWWCGGLASIAGPEEIAGNLFDEGSIRRSPDSVAWGAFESWDDGHTFHAPVGTYRANRFGLHDVLGNVWEWCEDESVQDAYQLPVDAQDGHRRLLGNRADGPGARVNRGGSFYSIAANARSAYRFYDSPSVRRDDLGLRPARGITRD